MAITQITGSDFEAEISKSQGTVVLDIWGDGCAPCKALLPILEQVAAERTDVRIVKMNFSDGPEIATELQLMGLPTLYLFRDGKLVKQQPGLQSKSQLLAWIDA